MNIRYFNEFRGLYDDLYRMEILTQNNVVAKAVKSSVPPFKLVYQDVRKLDPVRGSQATIGLISQSNFQFSDLHTDDMQGYQVKFYRDGKLYWLGWLDAELYNEQLSAVPPYPVEFSAADFNIWERLKYRDANEKRYMDIVPFIKHLKRCFERLNLPFNKLYIGCTTTPNDVAMSASETPLHVLYMMSDNFYDEENESMTCREVVESILQPFGLMMVQKDANVFIYDYNTVKQGLPMKRYDFSSLSYEATETVNFNHGNLTEIGFMSADGDYGFEEMVNNVNITSSLYGNKNLFNGTVSEKTLSEKKNNVETGEKYKVEYFSKDTNIESLNGSDFVIYTNTDSDATMIGALLPYTPKPVGKEVQFRVKSKNQYIFGNKDYFINVKVQAYANTRKNPFDNKEAPQGDISRAKVLWILCNLYLVDENGKILWYYVNTGLLPGWWPVGEEGVMPSLGNFELFFTPAVDTWNGNPLNVRMTNSDMGVRNILGGGYPSVLEEKKLGIGQNVQLGASLHGYLVLEIINECRIDHPGGQGYPYEGVKNILINDISISIKDKNKDDITTDDYEFKSYVNKKVKADFEDITLKCISANEEYAPVGKANILKKVVEHYELQLLFTRSGQTNILERLLMCTIHSNYTTKNEKMTVDVKMTDNPALSYVSCNPILSDKYLVTGCTLDFHAGITTISAVSYSDDVMELSNIPYDE